MSEDDQSMPYPERPPIDVKSPSADPRWDQAQIQAWRQDGARLRQNIMPVVLETNAAGVIEFLKVLGFTQLTEDLLYVFWVSLPIVSRFAQSRIGSTCHNPEVCAASAIAHMVDGMDFVAAHLLYIEDNYLGKSLV